MRRRTGVLAAALVLAGCVAACAGAGRQGSGAGDRDRLTPAQLAATNTQSLYDAIERLRPEWLTSRGPTSVTDATLTMPSVFMDGQLMGKVDYLRDLRITDVTFVRFWPAGQAAARFGMGHPRGVIEISRR
ncbi:MAG TPA: hypothetical protein VFQ38_12435 [Longimicrobiales bacterium]|nr:hypothetical protein [Longimicrobiales bacterium]